MARDPRIIILVLGTRPEVVKLAPVILELERREFAVQIIATGQHRELLEQAMMDFQLVPAYRFDSMLTGQTLAALSSRLCLGLDKAFSVLGDSDAVLVQGDTTSALMGALVAFYRNISVGHVEAGLRTHVLSSPFPEELNRRLITVIARWHFAPTALAADNLRKDGVDESACHIVGNTVVDSLASIFAQLKGQSDIRQRYPWAHAILATCHRRENRSDTLPRFCEALVSVVQDPEVVVVYPVHPNSRSHPSVTALERVPRIELCEPLSYPRFLHVMRDACMVVTDSGGVIEEATVLRVPTLVIRDVMERTESLVSGSVSMSKADNAESLALEIKLRLRQCDHKPRRDWWVDNPYGRGDAARRIVDILDAEVGGKV